VTSRAYWVGVVVSGDMEGLREQKWARMLARAGGEVAQVRKLRAQRMAWLGA
jgi:hypothetical protein